jgi:dTDP-L-rhamnose 4-epimerase
MTAIDGSETLDADITHVLVTGGAGFIGSAIVDALVASGRSVTVLDNLDPAAHSTRPDYLNGAVRYVWGDCRDRSAWDEALEGVDAVCHQAGKVGLGVDFGDVDSYVTHNDAGWAMGLRALHERMALGHAIHRVVLASSMVVYGEGRYHCGEHGVVVPGPRRVDDLDRGDFEPRCPLCDASLMSAEISEDAPLDPRNVYAATKLHQEHLLSAFVREHPLRWAAMRYHNVYGPRMPRDTPYAGVASLFRSAFESGRAPTVTEDGRQRRNFVHVHDVARANVLALLNPDASSGAYNIASQASRTVGEMADALAVAFGHHDGSNLWPTVTGGYRLGDVRHVYASPAKAIDGLGFRSAIEFEAGMQQFAVDPLRSRVG